MTMKRTILHIIYNLGRGGAETMLVKVIAALPEYNHVVVTLEASNHFGQELVCEKLYCLQTPKPWHIPLAVVRLKKIINRHQPSLVHSHLFWPTLTARMAVPKRIPLLTTIHAFIASSIEYKSRHIVWLDKLSYRFRPSIIIAVAKGAQQEYFEFLKLKPFKSYVLYTFADMHVFDADKYPPATRDVSGTFRLINIGALRVQKNQKFLLKAMHLLRDENIELDIYGCGPEEQALREQLIREPAKVNLMGEVKNIQELIPSYHLMVMSSTFEGFSLAVLEAMAMKIPLGLSNISSFREQCESSASYFELSDEGSFVAMVRRLKADPQQLKSMSELAYSRVRLLFTFEQHMASLKSIYEESIQS